MSNPPGGAAPAATPFTAETDGVRVAVRLTPKAGRNAVHGLHTDAAGAVSVKVSVTAVAEKGKANAALVKLLSRQWRVGIRSVDLISGAQVRNKCIRVNGDPGPLMDKLTQWARDLSEDRRPGKRQRGRHG